MSVERIIGQQATFVLLNNAKDFTHFIQLLEKLDVGYSMVSKLPMAQFVQLIETMVRLHYNEFFSRYVKLKFESERGKRQDSIERFFKISWQNGVISDIVIYMDEFDRRANNELSLGTLLNRFVIRLHAEKSNQARTVSVLGSHLSHLFFTRLRSKKTDIEQDMHAIKAEKDKVDMQLHEAKVELTETHHELEDAGLQLAAIRAEYEDVAQLTQVQAARMETQTETILQLEAQTAAHLRHIDALKANAARITMKTAALQTAYHALEKDYQQLTEGFQTLLELDDVCFEQCIEALTALEKKLDTLQQGNERLFTRLQTGHQRLQTLMSDEAKQLIRARQVEDLQSVMAQVKTLVELQHGIETLKKAMAARNDADIVKKARAYFDASEPAPLSLDAAESLASKTQALQADMQRRLQGLTVPIPQAHLARLCQLIAEGRYEPDNDGLADALHQQRAALSQASEQTARQLARLTTLKTQQAALIATQKEIITQNRRISVSLKAVQKKIEAAQARVTKAKTHLDVAEQALDNVTTLLFDVRAKVNALSGGGSVSLAREARLRELFHHDPAGAIECLQQAVTAVEDYLHTPSANRQWFVRSAKEKRDAIGRLAAGLSNGGQDLASIRDGDTYIERFNALLTLCRLNRSVFHFGRRHLANTPSSRLFKKVLDRTTRARVETLQAEQAAHELEQARLQRLLEDHKVDWQTALDELRPLLEERERLEAEEAITLPPIPPTMRR